jgi:CheY-like chemotaxis protein
MPHTILVVDDNDAFRGMLSSVLSMRGYQAIVARSSAEGLQLAAEYPIDAALVDVEMPDTDGFEFCRLLREQSKAAGREVPVWIMTGAMRLGLNRKAEAVGALVVLRKPLNVDETCAQFEHQFHQRTSQTDASAG